MGKNIAKPELSTKLKTRMEEFLNSNLSAIKNISPRAVRELFEDLQIYQTELDKHSEKLQKVSAELQQSEAQLRSILKSMDDLVFTLDRDCRFISINAPEEKLYLKPEEFIGKEVSEVLPSHIDKLFTNALTKIKSRGTAQFECHLEMPDGLKWHNVTLSPIMKNDEFTGSVAVVRDITERKRMEEALRETEKLLLESAEYHQVLFENSPTALNIQNFSNVETPIKNLRLKGVGNLEAYLQDNPDEVLQLAKLVELSKVNKAAVDLYSAGSPGKLLRSLDQVIVKDDWQHFIDQVVTFTNGIDWYEGEARNYTFEGKIITVIVRKIVLNREKNGLSKILVSIIDVTNIVQAYQDKEKLESQLQQARKMESIGTLAGGIAHDFNNLLYMITGNAELALEDIPKWNPVHTCLEEIKNASLRATGIAGQLLNFSRKTDQELKPIDAIPVIKDALKFLRSTIPSNIEIRKHLPDTDVTILADPIKIHQVLMNICTNASQEMEETGGILEITVGNESLTEGSAIKYPDLTAGEYIILTVSDTGPGITPEIIDRIFDPYYTTKDVGKSSGMGLAVVLGIVKSHGGAITVDSQIGKGAIFTILFPMVAEKSVMKIKTPDEMSRGDETILFVDDEKSISDMVKMMLYRLGYTVDARTNPVEALELFKSKPDHFDMVITDMTMPQMTGVRLLEKLKDARPNIPVIICTGHSSLIDEDKAKDLEIAALVMKPIVMADIAKTIRQVLDNNESSSQD